jgi:putative component of toxin-antitoxin plasmid stabilization module
MARRADATAAAKVTIALARIEQGNLSNAKGVGSGVFECKIDFGRATYKQRKKQEIQ